MLPIKLNIHLKIFQIFLKLSPPSAPTSYLRNSNTDSEILIYRTPTSIGCMEGGSLYKLVRSAQSVLEKSIEGARHMDEVLGYLMEWPSPIPEIEEWEPIKIAIDESRADKGKKDALPAPQEPSTSFSNTSVLNTISVE